MIASYGPWTTSIGSVTNPHLCSFWKRRLAMISQASKCSPTMTRSNSTWLVAFACLALALPLVRASALGQAKTQDESNHSVARKSQKDLIEYLPRPSPAELKIQAALEKPVTMEFQDSPLSDVIDLLCTCSKVNIVVDRVALEAEGVTPETPITVKLDEIRLGSALPIVLEQLNLAFVVENDVLKITSLSSAGNILKNRTYPVRDLCKDAEDFDELKEAILNTISPNSWSDVGGAGTIRPVKASGSLVINQTFAVHAQVLQLLRTLREAKEKGSEPPSGKVEAPAVD
jgi:hypothetical protein